MSIFAVALVTPKDPETFAKYRDVAGEALGKHGGRVATVLQDPVRLEGSVATPKAIALLEFPNVQAAHNWHNDPELKNIHALRTGGADVSIFVESSQ